MKKTINLILGMLPVLLMTVAVSAEARQRQEPFSVTDSIKAEKIYLPVNTVTERALTTGNTRTFAGEDIEKYPSQELLNTLTGIIPGLFITEINGATGQRFGYENIGIFSRGFDNKAINFIIDDVVIEELAEVQLTPEDIESITLVNNTVDKARFGPQISGGAIYIRTLKGIENGRQIKVGFEKGIERIDRLPEWCNGVEYATLNNNARLNMNALTGEDTYPVRFDDNALKGFMFNLPYDPEYPNVDYKSLLIKDTRDYNKAYINIRGGSPDFRYSANVGYVNQGDIIAEGCKKPDFNRFNSCVNIDLDINPRLTANISFIGTYSIRNSPIATSGTSGAIYEFSTLWTSICKIPAVEYPLVLGVDEETGRTIYPVSSLFPNNPYASIKEGGYYKESFRVGMTKANLAYDLGKILKGLKSETQASYHVSYVTRIGKVSDYMGYIYQYDPETEQISTQVTSHVGTSSSSEGNYGNTFYHSMQFHEKLFYDLDKGGHHLNTSLTFYRSKLSSSLQSSYHKQQNTIFSLSYNYMRKYLLDIVADYAGTSALKSGHRYQIFPAAGLGWIVSEEDFLKESSWLSFMKFRVQAGLLGYETFGNQYLWESNYSKTGSMAFGPHTANQWFGSATVSTTGTNINRVENSGLGWQTNKELNAGVDIVLFNKFSIGYTRFNTLMDGIVVDVASVLPMYYGAASMMDNYKQVSIRGNEISVEYSDRIGNLGFSAGASLMETESSNRKYLEVTTYDNLRHEGKSTGAVFGYDFIGRFTSQEDIDNSPVQQLGDVHVGDLKYRDVTGDGVVNSNDLCMIGDTYAKYRYSLNLHLSWKNLDMTVVGTGAAGFDTFKNNSYYWNGWGDGNMSRYVRDYCDDPDMYPGLFYVKSNNNFTDSQYWKVKGDWFKIQNVEVGYDFNIQKSRKLGLNRIRLFARGANLITISGIKDCDPEAMEAGVSTYPLFKTYTGGLKFTF